MEALEPRLPTATARHLAMLTWALGGLQLGCHVCDDFWSKLEAGGLAGQLGGRQAGSRNGGLRGRCVWVGGLDSWVAGRLAGRLACSFRVLALMEAGRAHGQTAWLGGRAGAAEK